MKLNVDEAVKDLNGEAFEVPKTFKDGKVDKTEKLTVKKVLLEALLASTESDRSMTGVDKFERYALASIVNKGGEITFTVEEAAKIKARVGEVCTPLIVGHIWTLMEDKKQKTK